MIIIIIILIIEILLSLTLRLFWGRIKITIYKSQYNLAE